MNYEKLKERGVLMEDNKLIIYNMLSTGGLYPLALAT